MPREARRSTFEVVVNAEEQYSIWPATEALPIGWRVVGIRGPKTGCLNYVGRVWTDMKPLSLRHALAAAEKKEPRQ